VSSDPFIGPRPYTEADQEDFFGRAHQVAELVSMLTANRVVLLYAVSGAGKTSLLRAGLLPALAKQGLQVFGPIRPRSPVAPPPSSPNVFVHSALTELTEVTGVSFDLAAGATLADALAMLPTETDAYGFPKARCLVLDQFEELLTAFPERWEDRRGFVEQIAAALDADPSLRVLFSIREDYLAQVERYGGEFPNGFRARYHLERFGHDGALAAIRGPLERRGLSFSDEAAGRLIRDLSETRVDVGLGGTSIVVGEFVEPVHLQVVCRRLWEHIDGGAGEITVADLDRLGGVDDCLTTYYDTAVARAARSKSSAERRIRAAMESDFITASGTRAAAFVGTDGTEHLPMAVLRDLEDAHLLRGEWRAGARWLEIAHDRLVEPIRISNAAIRAARRRRRLRAAVGVVGGLLIAALVSLPFVLKDDAAKHGLTTQNVRTQIVVSVRTRTVETSALPGRDANSAASTGAASRANGAAGRAPATPPQKSRAEQDEWGKRTGLTVFLASLSSPERARRFGRSAERDGLKSSILYSSLHASLHPGFWVVFTGRFQNYDAVITRLNKAHDLGYDDAQWSYVLPIRTKR
jgi:hypothetical protein